MPAGHTLVRDVGKGSRMVVHGQRVNVPKAADNTDPLPELWSRTYRGINYCAHVLDAWDRALNLLYPDAGQSDGTYYTGV